MQLSAAKLKSIAVYATQQRRATYLPLLNAAFAKYQINTPWRIAAFMAQVLHESGSFRYVQEIADGSAYEGRADLGNTDTGDGPRYKGRGLIQITGRANYQRCGLGLGLDLISRPDDLELPENAVLSAAWFWNTHNCNALADVGNFNAITKVINGGYNGTVERLKLYAQAKAALGIA